MSASDSLGTSLPSSSAKGTESSPKSPVLEERHHTEGQTVGNDEAEGAETNSDSANDTLIKKAVSLSLDKSNETNGNDELLLWLKQFITLVSTLNTKTENDRAKGVAPATLPTVEAVVEPPDAHMYRTRPMIRDCDWHEFKNRYPDEGECCAIETLLSSRDLGGEIQFEQMERKAEVKQRSKPRDIPAKTSRPRPGDISDQRIERVRINSAFILAYLAKVTGERSWERRPHSFLQPFKIFIYYHKKMADEFDNLRKRFAPDDGDHPSDEVPSASGTSLSPEAHDLTGQEPPVGKSAKHRETTIDTEKGSLKAYQDMKCYMTFMQTRILPLYTMFEKADYKNPIKVRYSDIWYLFRHGEILFRRPSRGLAGLRIKDRPSDDIAGSESRLSTTADTQLWRVWSIAIQGADWIVDDLADKATGKLHRDRYSEESDKYTDLSVYYIDSTGKGFAPVLHQRRVYWYEGERDVTSLPVYPIRFVQDSAQLLQRLRTRGERFRSLVSQPHPTMSFVGWTLIRDPSEEQIKNHLDEPINFPEHIDSDVVIDFQEAYQTYPLWEPAFFTVFDSFGNKPTSTIDEFGIKTWAGRDRSKQTAKNYEMIVQTDGIEIVKAVELAESADFLVITRGKMKFADNRRDFPRDRQDLSPEDLTLLPCRVFVYSLRDRKFVSADIRDLKPIKREKATFEKLKISATHKTQIQSAVYEHFEKKRAQEKGRESNLEISDQDFIRGKGRGLVMLLHGAPGVGKTATAEAVADVYKKPLFPITCGDLGIEPKEVEANLTEIFRLANVWDCILLLDEAEIFLSPRAKRDDNLQRNALVSIFLRILEYYPGILFLTTNRAGALDEAVKSRVHFALRYPQLSRDDTISIFRMNIERLKMIEKERVVITNEPEMAIEARGIIDFARQHYDNFSGPDKADCRWNGRQIRNAFQIASSMARYEYYVENNGGAGEDGLGLNLGAHHFKMVEKTTVEYDEFRKKTLGATDSELALMHEERGPESAHRPNPPGQHASFESRRRSQSSFIQRQSQSSPTVPQSRDRRGNLTAPQSGRLVPRYGTSRQQTSGASSGSFHSYRGQDVDLNLEPGDDEADDHDPYEQNASDDPSFQEED